MHRVLVIEDNRVNMKLVDFLLKKAGYEVLQAFDAEQGIRLTREQLPNLVLMDIQLSGMDGLTATRILKADPCTAAIKIFALTALAMNGDERDILAAGCDGYISKPINYKDFLREVAWVLAEVQK